MAEEETFDGTLLFKIQKQCVEDGALWFPGHERDLSMLTLGLCGETGEFADWVKKISRGSHTIQEAYQGLVEELTDVFIYVMNLSEILKVDMLSEYIQKREKNLERFNPRRRN